MMAFLNKIIPYLPLEILNQIASSGSSQLWYNMALALPPLGRYSLRSYVQERMKAKFLKKIMKTLWNGRRVVRWILPNGKYHSPNDEPAWIMYYENGSLKRGERWYKDGKKHRENNQPAWIIYNPNGSKECEAWYKGGKFVK